MGAQPPVGGGPVQICDLLAGAVAVLEIVQLGALTVRDIAVYVGLGVAHLGGGQQENFAGQAAGSAVDSGACSAAGTVRDFNLLDLGLNVFVKAGKKGAVQVAFQRTVGSNYGCTSTWGVRPALILPSNLLVSDDGSVNTNTAPTTPGSTENSIAVIGPHPVIDAKPAPRDRVGIGQVRALVDLRPVPAVHLALQAITGQVSVRVPCLTAPGMKMGIPSP